MHLSGCILRSTLSKVQGERSGILPAGDIHSVDVTEVLPHATHCDQGGSRPLLSQNLQGGG